MATYCACGCGTILKGGKSSTWSPGHHRRGKSGFDLAERQVSPKELGTTGTSIFAGQYNDEIETKEISVEDAVALVVKNRFKVNDIGSLLLKLATQENGEEKSMLFAKLIAKARIARIKH